MSTEKSKCEHTDVISFTFSERAGGETISKCGNEECTHFDADRKRILRNEGGRQQ